MALTSLDFTAGIDFTGLTEATAADHSTLIEAAEPKSDGGFDGKGLILTTTDSALNTPVVPDANASAKWRRYLWIRKPHSSEPVSTTPMIYAWDENTENDATYQKWVQTNYSIAFLEADVAELQGLYNSVNTDVQSSLTIANAANTLANTASNSATAANAKADAAQTLANSVNTTATQALTKATDASTQANNALAAVAGKRLAKDALIPGTAGQMLRVNSAGSEVEWFNVKDTYFKAVNWAAQQTITGDIWNAVIFNSEEHDSGNLGVIEDNKVKLIAGTYYVRVTIPCTSLGDTQAFIGNNSTKQIISSSTSGSNPLLLEINCIITLTATTVIDVYIHPNGGGKLSQGSDTVSVAAETQGLPAGYGAREVDGKFSTFEAWKIG